ncbi:ABC transporter permease (plasmid) [Deinococcus psychrotolerans]|uniref:ABC transporter permease n=1 Tax=Deinococcus psychrotolerans TaxID=2489213 RepID=A0A3G8YHC6_9DEIO|nr:ABC transporter permease [Deinococcus psychrotolerans]AZI44719.1 ABC transporter permease [Deinococcus psychrotolerans]
MSPRPSQPIKKPASRSVLARTFRRNLPARIGAALICLYLLVALLAPVLAPPQGNCRRALNLTETQVIPGPAAYLRELLAPPDACLQMPRQGFAAQPKPPAEGVPLGSVNGYDIRYGLVWGTRTAFFLGLSVVAITVTVGGLIGLAAGFFGGWLDNVLMRLTDVTFAFPGLILVLVLVAALGPGLQNIIIALSLVSWAGPARILRSEVLRLRELDYVAAARGLGSKQMRIALRHVLPNALGPVFSIVVLDMGSLPIVAGALSFLGLGTPLGFADWGQLIALAQKWIQGPPGEPFAYWYVTLFPGLCIAIYSLGWNLLGDALGEQLDPRNR